MGRRAFSAAPFVARRVAAQLARQDFAAVKVRIQSLIQEARALREEAMALASGQFYRRGQLHRQALLCATEAIELLRVACMRTDGYDRGITA